MHIISDYFSPFDERKGEEVWCLVVVALDDRGVFLYYAVCVVATVMFLFYFLFFSVVVTAGIPSYALLMMCYWSCWLNNVLSCPSQFVL